MKKHENELEAILDKNQRMLEKMESLHAAKLKSMKEQND